ncbi:hypothetical protein O3P69_018730 [Scylla paramamosain]|uniref:dUTP diphosphatase n=1 Tax=Scylla paramamosain TaxID=85552 RepID=A0AAW0STF2_SCYPA
MEELEGLYEASVRSVVSNTIAVATKPSEVAVEAESSTSGQGEQTQHGRFYHHPPPRYCLGFRKTHTDAVMPKAVVYLGDTLKKEEGLIKYKLLGEEARAPEMEDRGIFGKVPMFLSMEYRLVPPVSSKIVKMGVAISLPIKSCYMQLQSSPLSSGFYAIENSVHMTSVQAGVIDADYRGEVKVVLKNDSKDQIFEIKPGLPVVMGVLYDVACPVTRLIDATGAIENLIGIDDKRNEIDERSPRFINSKSCYWDLFVFRSSVANFMAAAIASFVMCDPHFFLYMVFGTLCQTSSMTSMLQNMH